MSFSDEGPGIPKHEIKSLFEPFSQVSTTVKASSTESSIGLGLVIVKKMVDIHHGEIQVSSVVGEGTTISVVLPKVPKNPAQCIST